VDNDIRAILIKIFESRQRSNNLWMWFLTIAGGILCIGGWLWLQRVLPAIQSQIGEDTVSAAITIAPQLQPLNTMLCVGLILVGGLMLLLCMRSGGVDV